MSHTLLRRSWISESGSHWTPVRAFLFAFGLSLVFGSLLTSQTCHAQQANQSGNPAQPQQSGMAADQQSDQMADQQTGQSAEQLTGQSTNQLTDQSMSQQGCTTGDQQIDPSANQQLGQPADQQSGQFTSEQTGQLTNQQTGQPTNQQTGQLTTAAQIIAILQQEPDTLENIKEQVAQQLGVDPTSLTDQAIYNRIQLDPSVRDLAIQALIQSGINPCMGAQNQNPRNPASATLAPRTTQQQPAPLTKQPRPYENPDDPQALHRTSPYKNLPSLRDLYSQFSSTKEKLRRFGSDAFLRVTGNVNQLPMDLPAGPDYVLGPGDSLVINIWGGQSSRLERPVDRQGQIALPEAGTVTIAGLTIAQAQNAIQRALGTQFQNEKVEISLGRVRAVRIYVVGDVQRPGAYDVSSLSTPVNALYAAGGPTDRGSLRTLRQYRGTQLVREIDLYDFLLHGIRSDVDRLQPGDTLLVPPVGAQVSVAGLVRRPAIYELKGEQELNQILDLAGGVLVSASLKQIRVERIEAHERRTMLSLELPADHDAAAKDLAAFRVQDGDSVLISQIMPYNEQAVYLDGHVFHPGKYPYREGMTINDLLHSYQDVMPEPADHAELIRLQPPDYRPETISFNLPDVLIGNDAIALQPFDVVRVFSRYEIDSPKVTIDGAVLRPGSYPMSQGMTAADLVRIAGGFVRSAYKGRGRSHELRRAKRPKGAAQPLRYRDSKGTGW